MTEDFSDSALGDFADISERLVPTGVRHRFPGDNPWFHRCDMCGMTRAEISLDPSLNGEQSRRRRLTYDPSQLGDQPEDIVFFGPDTHKAQDMFRKMETYLRDTWKAGMPNTDFPRPAQVQGFRRYVMMWRELYGYQPPRSITWFIGT